MNTKQKIKLPKSVSGLFWEYDPDAITWSEDADLIISKVLHTGTWEDVRWLRRTLGDAGLRDWLLQHKGAGLEPRRLRFWQLILNLPKREVDAWLARHNQNPWQRRWQR